MKTRVLFSIFVASFTSLTGCHRSAYPYDPTDARHALCMTASPLCYEDQGPWVQIGYNCWSVKHNKRMVRPKGNYVFVYTVTPEKGKPVVIRQPMSFGGGWTGAIKSLPAAPQRFPAGKYHVSAAAVLPSGKTIRGHWVQKVTVRKRECRMRLTSDKPAYHAGDTIVLTGFIENLIGRTIRFDKDDAPVIILRARSGSDSMQLTDISLPDKLEPGSIYRLMRLRFTAGKPDARFKVGCRREWFPPPFGRKGKYRIELLMSGHLYLDDGEGKQPVRRGFGAIPDSVDLEVLSTIPMSNP